MKIKWSEQRREKAKTDTSKLFSFTLFVLAVNVHVISTFQSAYMCLRDRMTPWTLKKHILVYRSLASTGCQEICPTDNSTHSTHIPVICCVISLTDPSDIMQVIAPNSCYQEVEFYHFHPQHPNTTYVLHVDDSFHLPDFESCVLI